MPRPNTLYKWDVYAFYKHLLHFISTLFMQYTPVNNFIYLSDLCKHLFLNDYGLESGINAINQCHDMFTS